MQLYRDWLYWKLGVKDQDNSRLTVTYTCESTEEERYIQETRTDKATGNLLGERKIHYFPSYIFSYNLPTRIDETGNHLDCDKFILSWEEFEIICNAIHAKDLSPEEKMEHYRRVFEELLEKGGP